MNTDDILKILLDISPKLFQFPKIEIDLFQETNLIELEKIKIPQYFVDKIPPFRIEIMSENHFINEYSQLSESEKSQYISKSCKVIYLHETIIELIEYMKNVIYISDKTTLYNKTMLFVNRAIDNFDKANLDNFIALFAFLHEIGHYERLVSKNYMPYEILNNANREETEADNFAIWWLGKLKHDNLLKLFS